MLLVAPRGWGQVSFRDGQGGEDVPHPRLLAGSPKGYTLTERAERKQIINPRTEGSFKQLSVSCE